MDSSTVFTSVPQQDNSEQRLNELLSRVGYGSFQKRLLILCGLGWLADNMWLQTIAMILPRIQDHYRISDQWIGSVSSSLFIGMTLGAFFWGFYSDRHGRKTPYIFTLLVAAIFGTLASLTTNFISLCICLLFLGFGIGGNIPNDGTLYLEFLPEEYHYLLTFMSVFFSLGAVLASLLGYMILPSWSCPIEGECDIHTQNNGWRILLLLTSTITFSMLLLRLLWLKLPETPKFLMSQDRTHETVIVLQDIAIMNCHSVHIHKDDLPSMDTESVQSPSIRSMLLSVKWRKTVVLVWGIWTFTSMGYTMFNVFLPKYLQVIGLEDNVVQSTEQVYWDYMIYSLSGVPGSIVAAYMIETRLGRIGTMALSAFGSSLSIFLFSLIHSRLMMVISSSFLSLLATLLYAVIYGYTPEVFTTEVRGTAVGASSGLGRIAGIISPLLTGVLLTVNSSLPLYVSGVAFCIVGTCILSLPYETHRKV
ncbi:major facilitator superfamily domain-containing protein [Pilobolus umbonatus]|nr:major facilitator superfamily domain-containing protein [Pilobolus umbonatus]